MLLALEPALCGAGALTARPPHSPLALFQLLAYPPMKAQYNYMLQPLVSYLRSESTAMHLLGLRGLLMLCSTHEMVITGSRLRPCWHRGAG